MKSITIKTLLCGISAGLIPVIAYLSNTTGSMGFADAAEFALVTKLLSTAHPPGFPVYVSLGYLWSLLVTGLTGSHIWSMIILSAVCSGLTGLILFLTCRRLIVQVFPSVDSDLVAMAAAAAYSYGVTVWYWSGSVEVYALQALATSMAIYGVIRMKSGSEFKNAILAGTGIGIGLSNHHLTMILLLPFLVLLMYPGAFERTVISANGKQKKIPQLKKSISLWPLPNNIKIAALTAITVCIFAYGWMFIRSANEFVFEFGNPDTFSRLIYHLAGGAWMKNTAQEVQGIAGMRLPYFLNLILEQFFFFLPFLVIGWLLMFRFKMYRLGAMTFGYFFVILVYQLRIDQTSDTDAYLIPAFVIASMAVAVGFAAIAERWKNTVFLVPLLMLSNMALSYPRTNKQDFNVSSSLMESLDASAPDSSVILISDWTLSIQYHYFRIVENFRPDLTVLNYDLKFTNYKSVPLLYPELYKAIGPEYDKFVQLLGTAHPQEIYNTGCTLDTPELMNAYKETVKAIQRYCDNNNRDYMVDPKAFVFQMQNGLMSNSSTVSGCFVSSRPTGIGKEFINLPFKWLNSEITLREPAATDKLVDFEAMLDFHRNYYRSTGDTIHYTQAEQSYMRIKTLQRKVKQKLPFVFRSK